MISENAFFIKNNEVKETYTDYDVGQSSSKMDIRSILFCFYQMVSEFSSIRTSLIDNGVDFEVMAIFNIIH